MILTLLGIASLVIGGSLIHIGDRADNDICFNTGAIGFTAGIFITLICSTFIIVNHCAVDKAIYDTKLRYEALIKQVETVNSEYEDVSKTTVINRVYKWNRDVYSEKYWSENLWTNWFYSRQYVDSLKYIDMEDTNAEDKTQTWISPRD